MMTLFMALTSFLLHQKEKPVFFIIGDSTVRNGDGTGKGSLWGWGSFIADQVDTNKLQVQNHAMGGRSSRTFQTEGRWEKVVQQVKKGDFVIMQFGHNDASPLDDTARARGVLRGISDKDTSIYNPIRKIQETVYTYGWYMRKFVRETKAKGATAIICSLVPRNSWKDGKIQRSGDSWALWARQIAEQEGAYFIDLNELTAAEYDKLGQEKVKALYFPSDNTHTNKEGALINTAFVIDQLRKQNPAGISQYLR
ncbi:MAG: rhamnogalacturonan acetylesterase [Chitinophagales bacterium]|nr:rhamnogalacturonan acetylesterase [Chitinophagales bacterium]